jgi:signal transduction histidine kinase
MSLHRRLSLFIAGLATLALIAAVSLILLTTYLHRTTLELEEALQSVRLGEEMQIDLLTYVRTRDGPYKTAIARDLRQKLRQSENYVSAAEEGTALNQATQLIEDYFSSEQTLPPEQRDAVLDNAFAALKQFVDVNVEQADTSLRESEQWDTVGDRIGIGVGVGLIAGTTMMLIWLGVFGFRGVFEIRDAMKDFAIGRKAARAPERGPEELRSIAAQFNSMADTLVRQYDNQLSFLAAVAHDLRNPISALKISADLLSLNQTVPPEKLPQLMSVIRRQVHQLDRMVGDLLDRSRIETGHLELRIEDCDARAIARSAFDLFSSVSTKHQFKLNLPDSAVPVRCDPLRIEQVLNNLLSNAIKYSPGGGKVELTLEEDDTELQFDVSDQGIGIPREEVPYVFEPFRRAGAPREDIPGVGLGLSVAHRIVQAHGGRIEIDTQKGKGTTFRVHLPAPQPVMIV